MDWLFWFCLLFKIINCTIEKKIKITKQIFARLTYVIIHTGFIVDDNFFVIAVVAIIVDFVVVQLPKIFPIDLHGTKITKMLIVYSNNQ